MEIGPLAAYNINVSPRASMHAHGRPAVPLRQAVAGAGGRAPTAESGYDISLLLRVPVLFHAFPHVFVGATPFTEIDLSSKVEGEDVAKTRTFGVTLDLGFWF